ncbi:MAG: helicase C-terminal domain-containing protein [Ktedonobacteraceae bacterium]
MGDATPLEIGPFAIIRLLHDGPFESVYLGKQQGRAKNYSTIHVFHTPLATDEEKEAFLARAKSLKKLKHRNIAESLDYGLLPTAEQPTMQGYLVTQYVSDKSILERFPQGKPVMPDEVKRALSPIADALQYAHASHIYHHHLHPGCILIDEGKQFLLTGFAPVPPQLYADDLDALPYMAPEMLQGDAGPASDQYALGVMVYEWLCGRRPYNATDRESLLRQQQSEPLPAPRSLNSSISPAVEQVLLKTLALNPADRYPRPQMFSSEYLRALMGFGAPATHTTGAPGLGELRADTHTDAINRVPTAPRNDKSVPHSVHNSSEQPAPASRTEPASIDEPPDDHVTEPDPTRTPVQEPRPLPKRFSTGSISDLGETVTDDLREDGILSKRLEGYEERAAQVEMAQMVAKALIDEKHAIIEASTGTGKSLAYLLPIVRSGRGAIISTANKALQEQLFYKDIPFVQKNVQDFDAALVKGVGNYICLDRLLEVRQEGAWAAKSPDYSRLLNVVQEFELTIPGDFEALGFSVPGELMHRVNADRDQCTWNECKYFKHCYVRQMKEKAEMAQVIVVNHTLLLLDAASGGFVLPQREAVVIDEAHHLEEEATRAFTITASQSHVYALLAQKRLQTNSSPELQQEVKAKLILAWDRLASVADPGAKGRANLRVPLEEGLVLASTIEKLANSLEKEQPHFIVEKENILYTRLIARTRTLASNIRAVFSVDKPEKYVYYVERVPLAGRSRNISPLEVSAAPLDVTQWLKKHLFDRTHVISTSATLATVGAETRKPDEPRSSFSYFRARVGLDNADYPDILESMLPLSFDYEHNALLYLPRHLPPPAYGDDEAYIGYMKAMAGEMLSLVRASRGRAFLLFSSRRMLNDVYQEFLMRLESHEHFRLLSQEDRTMTRLEMVREFRTAENAVLFGLKSFWEGVDIAGEALSLVVIDKMPFDPPDDPVQEARVALMKKNGENWFGSYILPQAVLRLKQGLGRLLRTRDDRGVMAILDSRLHSKGYGKLVINALPPARRVYSVRDVERFFENDGDAPF